MNMSTQVSESQRGAVLIVALIMLLLLTIIGMSSMRGTSLQENMAGNLRESNLAFQAAEAGLRAGEQLAHGMFIDGSLEALQPGEEETGTYSSGFSDSASAPTFTITKLAGLRTSTEAGVAMIDEGVLVRIDSSGAGITRNESNQPVAQTELRSTYLVEQ